MKWSLLPLSDALDIYLFICFWIRRSVETYFSCQVQVQLQAISWKDPSQLKIAKTTLMLGFSVSIQISSKHLDWIVNSIICYLLLGYWGYNKNILPTTKPPWYPLFFSRCCLFRAWLFYPIYLSPSFPLHVRTNAYLYCLGKQLFGGTSRLGDKNSLNV